jgi:Protein of unknown function (DUF2631)
MTGMAERAGAAHGATASGDAAHDAPTQRHEQPGDWGWHGSWGKSSRIGGWACVIILCLINVTTYYNTAQAPWLYGTAGILALILIRDRYTRKNAWRDE